ncbi:MAG: hypothetical protein M3R27_02705 [Bacteroidota bacterium]|nr:hypothetical protein [Bacteroidota bacterium]
MKNTGLRELKLMLANFIIVLLSDAANKKLQPIPLRLERITEVPGLNRRLTFMN